MRRPADVFLLYAARAARGFGDGFAIIILPAYLSELSFGPFQIGIVASAALLGTAAVTARNRVSRSRQGPAQSSVAWCFCDSCDRTRISGHRAICIPSCHCLLRNNESFDRSYGTVVPAATCHA